ncbi:protein kinase [Nocardia neocaledoniensis NBRC 108232]|uniref:Serine/threonine protein kinase n=2 Tax=Nocardia neocaledoniensis TaxID=236511 RepID=A0A317N2J7_9NOCA|nr:serine/threonine protein kinase [Nocardia neocaledoniensis]GEM33974.1 protein kinase [Nocardia neocaledoniensis NBRC 108232]
MNHGRAAPVPPSVSPTSTTEATRPALDRTADMHPTDRRGLDRIEVGGRIGDFELLTELGVGAFARVFLARQRSMQRLVAVKISADSGTEPQTMAQLDHDYVVRVFDQHVLDPPADGSPALRLLYMQFLPGGTLLGVLRWVRATPPAERTSLLLLDAVDAAMAERGEIRPTDSAVRAEIARLSWPETVAWLGSRLARALQYAAANEVLHRDVKPANVLLTAEGVPKLADFNISYSRSAGTSPVSYFGGSLSYMSPEQLEACHPGRARTAEDLDTRADIYSLGVVLWELLTGQKPFDDTTVPLDDLRPEIALGAALERRADGIAADLVPADCPPTLRRVLLTCLAADRADRWPDGDILAAQLDLCLDGHARELVDPPAGSWRIRLRSFLFPVLMLAVAIPNMLAAAYNARLNTALIVDRLTSATRDTLISVAGVTNAAFFAAGAVVLIYAARRLLIVPRRLRKGRVCGPDTLDRTRRDCLRFGNRAVAVAFALWLVAAVVFAATIGLADDELPVRTAVHFLLAAAICAAIAMTYPFFLITLYLTRCVYPLFLHHGQDFRGDGVALTGLLTRCHRYLMTAASIPLLAVVSATFLPVPDLLTTTTPLRAVCVGGVLGFIGSYALFRLIEADIRALLRVVGS